MKFKIMKNIIIIIALILNMSTYSQTNRYTEYSTAKYTPMNNSEISDYNVIASKNRVRYIGENSQRLHDRINHIMSNYDDDFLKLALHYINETYLKPLLIGQKMSLSEAEWYFKKAKKGFKKTIRIYNRRIKKEIRDAEKNK